MRIFLLSACVALALLGLADVAHAADDGEKPNLLNINPVEVILTIVVFVVLLILLSMTVWKPILGALKQREETISKALDDAKAANEAAQAKIAEYEGRIQDAKEEAQAIADEARKDGEDIRARIKAEAQQEADAQIERAKREIGQMSAKAWDQVVRDAADVATEAARRIVGENLSDEGHAQLVAQVVADFTARTSSGNPGGGSA